MKGTRNIPVEGGRPGQMHFFQLICLFLFPKAVKETPPLGNKREHESAMVELVAVGKSCGEESDTVMHCTLFHSIVAIVTSLPYLGKWMLGPRGLGKSGNQLRFHSHVTYQLCVLGHLTSPKSQFFHLQNQSSALTFKGSYAV